MHVVTALVTAVGMLFTISVPSEAADLLPLEHGTYVREGYDVSNAPLAAILEYDGSTISGPHSSACVSELLDHEGAKYRIRTTCFADGDETPASPYKEKERIVVVSPTRMKFTHGEDQAVYRHVEQGSQPPSK